MTDKIIIDCFMFFRWVEPTWDHHRWGRGHNSYNVVRVDFDCDADDIDQEDYADHEERR